MGTIEGFHYMSSIPKKLCSVCGNKFDYEEKKACKHLEEYPVSFMQKEQMAKFFLPEKVIFQPEKVTPVNKFRAILDSEEEI